MKQPRLPLWLVCDVIALIGVMMTLWPLAHAANTVFDCLRQANSRRLRPHEFTVLGRLLAAAESVQAWAIWRQAFRANGLDARRVRGLDIPPPKRHRAFARRYALHVGRMRDLAAHARSLAAKIARVLTAGPRIIHRFDPPPSAAIRVAVSVVPLLSDKGGFRHARGPPAFPDFRNQSRLPRGPRQRGRRRLCARPHVQTSCPA